MPRSELVDIDAKVVRETATGVLIDDGKDRIWCPKQYVEDNKDGTVTIPEWLALEKGLI